MLGPDSSGKTVLSNTISDDYLKPYFHFTQESNYPDYLSPLVKLQLSNSVCDRYAFCEGPYSSVLGREFRFSLKEWHNLILLTLIQHPVVILCTRMKKPYVDSYLPEELWDTCLTKYRELLSRYHIPYLEYDYEDPMPTPIILQKEEVNIRGIRWWVDMWQKGIGCIGGRHPQVLLVAERLGPRNYNLLPFEAGPTGRGLSQILHMLEIPLADIAITNIVKDARGSTRNVSKGDLALFEIELEELKPKGVILMGAQAKKASKMLDSAKIPWLHIPHLGYLGHSGAGEGEKLRYRQEWKRIWGILTGEQEVETEKWVVSIHSMVGQEHSQ